jgi:hypothetical protein
LQNSSFAQPLRRMPALAHNRNVAFVHIVPYAMPVAQMCLSGSCYSTVALTIERSEAISFSKDGSFGHWNIFYISRKRASLCTSGFESSVTSFFLYERQGKPKSVPYILESVKLQYCWNDMLKCCNFMCRRCEFQLS